MLQIVTRDTVTSVVKTLVGLIDTLKMGVQLLRNITFPSVDSIFTVVLVIDVIPCQYTFSCVNGLNFILILQ
jgi:hypothetical protein